MLGRLSARLEPLRRKPRLLATAGVSVVVLGAGLLAWRTLAPAPALGGLPVAVVTVRSTDRFSTQRQFSGELVATRQSSLGFEQEGTVAAVLVQEGDRVTRGQALASLDDRRLRARRLDLQAQLAGAQALLSELRAGPRPERRQEAASAVAEVKQQLALATLQRDRRQELFRQGAIAREDVDRLVSETAARSHRLAQARSRSEELQAGTRTEQLEAQEAQVAQLQARLRQVDLDLDTSVLKAPFAGRIGTRSIDEGVVVEPGQPVISVVESGPREARVGVSPAVAADLAVGSSQTVAVGERTFPARVQALLPELDAASRTVTVVLTIPDQTQAAGQNLAVGQTVRLALRQEQTGQGFWLPTTALVAAGKGLWAVYVLEEPAGRQPSDGNPSESKPTKIRRGRPLAPGTGVVGRRVVELVHSEAERSLVRGTLRSGDQVIRSGVHRVVPGQLVTAQPAMAKP
ncbi:MAG: HlyD family efflux transporter periplasmic adaptor subunit [Cyanobacteria bacterium]|nr:HlyD family efflux transporter periplasmic adaptor subunit [Cyanobacteria bacterium bin.51]